MVSTATALTSGVANADVPAPAPTIAPLFDALGIDPSELTPDQLASVSHRMSELVETGVIDEEAIEEMGTLPPEQRNRLISDRADHSHGLATAMERYLDDQGIDIVDGNVRAAVAEHLSLEGVEVPLDEDGELQLRQAFTDHLEERGLDVDGDGLRKALEDAGYGLTPDEVDEFEDRWADWEAERVRFTDSLDPDLASPDSNDDSYPDDGTTHDEEHASDGSESDGGKLEDNPDDWSVGDEMPKDDGGFDSEPDSGDQKLDDDGGFVDDGSESGDQKLDDDGGFVDDGSDSGDQKLDDDAGAGDDHDGDWSIIEDDLLAPDVSTP